MDFFLPVAQIAGIGDIKDGNSPEVGPALYILTEKGGSDLDGVILRLREEKRLTMSKIAFFWESMLESVRQASNNLSRLYVLCTNPIKFIYCASCQELDFRYSSKGYSVYPYIL